MSSINWTNERRRLGDLIPWPRNPRQIREAQAERLRESVDQFGQVETLAIGPGDEVYNGHQRINVLAAQHGPDYEVDVRVASRPLTEKEREKLTVFLHKGAAGEWNFDMLANEFDVGELLDWGFEDWELGIDEDAIAGNGADAEAQVDRAAALQEQWQTSTGQIWQLGRHRLACGDCTDASVVERVMDGGRADMVNIDPPYGVDYHGQNSTMFYGKDKQGVTRDRIATDGNPTQAFDLLGASLALYPSDCAFIWHAPQFHTMARTEAERVGYEIFSVIVWNKHHANFGAMGARYKPKYEMALACKAEKIPWYGPDNEVTVWDIDRLAVNELHPTQKPVRLFERAIRNHTRQGEIVADFFSGSGTTIIACENLGRQCRAVEISPAYVAVALDRFYRAFGIEPELIQED